MNFICKGYNAKYRNAHLHIKVYSLKEHTNHIEFLKPSIKKENVYEKSSIIVFLLTYGLFYVSSILFPIDRAWYDALEKRLGHLLV